mmetsp:Transcript_28764/g.57385  ORF Transcript_28764/g.57385 Transcript_28764/m.57385 type:complete len:175 (+) Transcript_28764:70-594(+)
MDLDRYQRKIANAQEASVANNRKRLAEAEEEAKRKENEDEASPGPPQNFPPAGASHSTEGLAAASTRNPIPVEPQWSSQWARIYVTDAKIVDPKGDEIGGDGATKMSDTKDENSYVVKLTINYDCACFVFKAAVKHRFTFVLFESWMDNLAPLLLCRRRIFCGLSKKLQVTDAM